MDHLQLNTLSFPVLRGELNVERDAETDYCWGIEIHCGESPQLDFRNWPDDRKEQPLDWLASVEPYLYAQMLPLRVMSPDDLVGREFTFPQSPDDDSPDWPQDIGWPFFCLYLYEHDLVHPMKLTFAAKQGNQFRVEIAGRYSDGKVTHELHVAAWLDWIVPDVKSDNAADIRE